MHTNVLTALLGVSVGIVSSELLMYGSEIALLALVLGIAQVVLFFISRRSSRSVLGDGRRTGMLPLLSGIFCIALFIGVIRVQFSDIKSNFVCVPSCTFSGVVISSPEVKDVYQIFSVRQEQVDGEPGMYDVQVKAPLYPRYQAGDKLTLTGKVSEPQAPMQHEDERAFDYATYLRLHNIGSEMFYPKIEVVESDDTESQSLVTSLKRMQESFLATIFLYVSEPSASLASGMLFGDSSMSKELVQTFRVAGLSHIIVLSGFNIAVLIGFVVLILRFLPLTFRVIGAATFVILFVLMVGAEVSIVRASIMSFVALAALLVGRAYTARHALLLSLLAIILYEPEHLLHDVSLHLSFLATAGIVYTSDGLQMLFARVRQKGYREILTTTLAAYLATLPYILYTFGTISVYALFANMIVLPLVPLIMVLTFFTMVSAPLSTLLGGIFGFTTSLLGDFVIFIARLVESLPFASVTFSITPEVMVVLYVLLTVVFVVLVSRKKKKADETRETKNEEILSGVISY